MEKGNSFDFAAAIDDSRNSRRHRHRAVLAMISSIDPEDYKLRSIRDCFVGVKLESEKVFPWLEEYGREWLFGVAESDFFKKHGRPLEKLMAEVTCQLISSLPRQESIGIYVDGLMSRPYRKYIRDFMVNELGLKRKSVLIRALPKTPNARGMITASDLMIYTDSLATLLAKRVFDRQKSMKQYDSLMGDHRVYLR